MDLLLPCENEISAHLLRSRLLSYGVPSAVVHAGAATAYGNWITHPALLISEADLEEGYALLAAPEEPLDDTFHEPTETLELNENLGFTSAFPSFETGVVFGAMIGFAIAFIAFLQTIRPVAGDVVVITLDALLLLPLGAFYGAVLGAMVWPFLRFARACRREPDGSLPFHARLTFLLMYPVASLVLPFVMLALTLRERLRSRRASPFSEP